MPALLIDKPFDATDFTWAVEQRILQQSEFVSDALAFIGNDIVKDMIIDINFGYGGDTEAEPVVSITSDPYFDGRFKPVPLRDMLQDSVDWLESPEEAKSLAALMREMADQADAFLRESEVAPV